MWWVGGDNDNEDSASDMLGCVGRGGENTNQDSASDISKIWGSPMVSGRRTDMSNLIYFTWVATVLWINLVICHFK